MRPWHVLQVLLVEHAAACGLTGLVTLAAESGPCNNHDEPDHEPNDTSHVPLTKPPNKVRFCVACCCSLQLHTQLIVCRV